MRIATNSVSDTILNQIQQLSSDQSKLQTQISTGLRITQPEDDPAVFGQVINFQSQLRQNAQYSNNASAALALSQASYAGLQSLKSISDRAGQIAILGNNTLGTGSMQSYATEVNQLIEQAVQVGNSTYQGNSLYAGTAVDTPAFTVSRDATGQVTGVTYAGDAGQAPIALSATSTVNPATTNATNTGIGAFINQLVALRNGLQAGDPNAVTATQPGLQAGENVIVSAVAEAGGIQTRINAVQTDLTAQSTTLSGLISNADSTDIATTVVKLTQAQTAYQAAIQSASKILNLSLLDYLPTQ
jgi:flagellar hook-associated protein 3 FlgL